MAYIECSSGSTPPQWDLEDLNQQPALIMGTTFERNKNRSRPRKSSGQKARRQRDQKKRLVALGMDEAVVAKMNSREVLDKLKRPAKVVKDLSAAKA
jgi:hypothetical protein